MSGFDTAYFIGKAGYDGINPIDMIVLLGSSDRAWYEPIYVKRQFTPVGRINIVRPESPEKIKETLVDALVAFAPDLFKDCPSLSQVLDEMKDFTFLDFNLESKKIPACWYSLRNEAQKKIGDIGIFEAELKDLSLIKKLI